MMPENKPTNRERLREINEGIEQGIKDLFQSDKYRQYLSTIYNTGTQTGLIAALEEMRQYLGPEETELLALTDSALAKLRIMTDAEYDELELYPDFEP